MFTNVFFPKKSIVIGNRIPNDFFVTFGKGESDIAVHAGSYHLALKDAGIESYNIITYSSILPKNASRVDKPDNYNHGSVLETIMAVTNVNQNEIGVCGIIYGWLLDKKTKKVYGGLVCETTGHEIDAVREELNLSLLELYRGYSDQYDLTDIDIMTNHIEPNKRFGTALVAICFTNYIIPIIKK